VLEEGRRLVLGFVAMTQAHTAAFVDLVVFGPVHITLPAERLA
jgi:hypothetical protein